MSKFFFFIGDSNSLYWMHCVKAIKHFWKAIASIILWLQYTYTWKNDEKKPSSKSKNDVIIKCVHALCLFSSQSNNPSIKFGESSVARVNFFVVSPFFETHSSSANHFQDCEFYKYAFQQQQQNLHTQKATRVFRMFYWRFSAFGNIQAHVVVSLPSSLTKPWLCWHPTNTM